MPDLHTNLPMYLVDIIQCVRKRAVNGINSGKSYEELLNSFKLPALKERRDTPMQGVL